MPKLTIVQVTRFRWQIQNQKGDIIQSDIMLNNANQALDYIRAYVSSFLGWTFDVLPLEKK